GLGLDLGGEFFGFLAVHVFMEDLVDHDDGRGAAGGEALDKLDGGFAVGGDRAELDAELVLERVAGLVAAAQGAGEGAADLDVAAADGGAAEHRVEGYDLEHVDELKLQFLRDPGDGLVGDVAGVLLDEVEERQGGAALDRVVRNDFVDTLEGFWLEIHRKREGRLAGASVSGRTRPSRSRTSRGWRRRRRAGCPRRPWAGWRGCRRRGRESSCATARRRPC